MQKRTSHVSRLIPLLEAVPPGDLITYETLTEKSAAQVKGSTSALSAARRTLGDRGVRFETVWDTGLRRLCDITSPASPITRK